MFNLNFEIISFDDGMFYNFIQENFKLSETDILIYKNKKENFIEEILTIYKSSKKYNIKIKNLLNYTTIIDKENGFLIILPNIELDNENNINIELYANSFEVLENLSKIVEKYSPNLNDNITISVSEMFLSSGNIKVKTKTYEIKEFNWIHSQFYPFLKLPKFVDFYMGHENEENLLILLGEYGVGKTKFIDYILKYVGENFKKFYPKRNNETLYVLYIKDINLLSNSGFWNESSKYDIIVLDDLEFSLLAPRKETMEDVTKNIFISNLLSFLDGITKNRTKVIITSNTEKVDIDSALLREGRLFGILQFRGLYIDEIESKNFKELLKVEFKFSEKDIEDFMNEINKQNKETYTQAELYKLIKNFKSQKQLININDFLNDTTINLLNKNNNKVGFF